MLGLTQEEALCSDATAREVDEDVRDRIGAAYVAAKDLLRARREALEAAADALEARETLTGEELAAIVAGARPAVGAEHAGHAAS
jgi:cell division protease FtsH